jgi:hypothetical protein
MAKQDRSISRGTLVGSAILGFLLEWSVIIIYGLSTLDGGTTTGIIVSFVALPVLCALPLLHPSTRYAGAGLLIGLALGSITGAGVCGGFIAMMASTAHRGPEPNPVPASHPRLRCSPYCRRQDRPRDQTLPCPLRRRDLYRLLENTATAA